VRATFRSLQHRNYRLFFTGQIVSMAGTWTQLIAQSWLVLELSGDRPVSVGIVTALQYLPSLVLGLWGGLLADRFDKRRMLIATQGMMAVVAGVLAVITIAGLAELWIVYLAAFLTGLATVPDMPLRQAFISEMVPDEDLQNAVSLNSAAFNSARIIGPAIAGGVLWAGGAGVCFLVNAVSYLAVIVSLVRMRPAELRPHPRLERAAGQLREGIRYVWASTELRSYMVLSAAMGCLGMSFQVIVPVLAKVTFEGNEGTFSLLVIAQGIGALVSVLYLATHPGDGRTVYRSTVAFSAALVVAGLAPSLPVLLVVMPFIGAFMIVSLSASNAIVQLVSRPQFRGRVLSVRGLFILGGAPIGGLLAGWIGELASPRLAIAVAGVGTAAIVLAVRDGIVGSLTVGQPVVEDTALEAAAT
jgi:MFS family permease